MPTITEVIRQHPCRYCGEHKLRLIQVSSGHGATTPTIECRACGVQGLIGEGTTEYEAWQIWNSELWLQKVLKARMKK